MRIVQFTLLWVFYCHPHRITLAYHLFWLWYVPQPACFYSNIRQDSRMLIPVYFSGKLHLLFWVVLKSVPRCKSHGLVEAVLVSVRSRIIKITHFYFLHHLLRYFNVHGLLLVKLPINIFRKINLWNIGPISTRFRFINTKTHFNFVQFYFMIGFPRWFMHRLFLLQFN